MGKYGKDGKIWKPEWGEMKNRRNYAEPTPEHVANMNKLLFIIRNRLIKLDGKWVTVTTNIAEIARHQGKLGEPESGE